MHDERRLIEERARARPASSASSRAIYAAHGPARTSTAWQVPGEPVPVARGAGRRVRAVRGRRPLGPRPGARPGSGSPAPCPPSGRAGASRPSSTSASSATGPASRPRGWSTAPTARPIKGIDPRNQYVPVADPAAGGEQVDLLRRGGRQPRHPRRRLPCRPRSATRPTAGDEPLYRLRPRRPRRARRGRSGSSSRTSRCCGELMRELPRADPRRARDPARPGARAGRARPRTTSPAPPPPPAPRSRRRWPRPAHASAHTASRPSATRTSTRAWLWPLRETVRKVARTFANVTALAGRVPRVRLRLLAGPAVRLDQGALPGGLGRGSQEAVADGPVRAGRRHVGRVRHQHARRRGAGPPARPRQALLPRRVRRRDRGASGCPTPSATPAACRRSPRLAGLEWFLTQKISWNQTNKFPHHTFWWEGIDGTRIFTHFPPVDTYNAELQRRASSPTRSATSRTRAAAPARWCRSATATAAAAPPGRCSSRPRRLRDLEGSPTRRDRDARTTFFADGRARSTRTPPVWSGELYLELHRGTYTSQAAHQAGQPAQRAPAARGRAVGGDRRRAHRARLPVRASWTGSGRPCCCTSSTTSCPAARSPGCTARPRRPTRGSPPSWTAIIERDARWRGARPGDAAADARAWSSTPRGRTPARPASAAGGARRAVAGRRPAALGVAGDGHRGARRTATCSTTAWSGSRSTATGCWPRCATWPPAARCSRPARAATCCSCTPTCPTTGTPGTSTSTTAHRSPTSPTPTRSPSSSADRWSARCAIVRSLRRLPDRPDGHACARGQPARRHRDRGRLARAREDPQGGVPARRARRPLRRGDPVRPRLPADPHQHQLGRGPVRGLRATAGCTSASRATASRVRQRLDLRPRRRPAPPAPTAGPRPRCGCQPAAGAALPRPGGRPGHAPADATRCCPAPTIARRRREGLRAEPAAARGCPAAAGRRAAGDAWTTTAVVVEAVKLADDRSRRRGRPALRVARRPGRSPAAHRLPGRRGRGHRPAGAPAVGGRRTWTRTGACWWSCARSRS